MPDYKNISTFGGLNALRFFAAFLVVMHHTETIKKKNGLLNYESLGLFRDGGTAVLFFFVLSGFLITYLLLKEHDKRGTVSVKTFYLKRVLRIWPLYYLLFIIGTLLLPWLFGIFDISYEMPYTIGQVWYYFVFFVPGFTTFFFGNHFLEPLWSIGVEEVFYLMWAPLFKFGRKNILAILLTIILLKILLMTAGVIFLPTTSLFNYIMNTFSFEAMAIGGLGAYFIYNRKKPLSELFIYKKPVQLILYAILATYLIFHSNIDNVIWNSVFKTPVILTLALELLFLYLIIGVSLIDHNLIKFKSKKLSYLGEISYGIYMYHMLVIFTVVLLLKPLLAGINPYLGWILFYVAVTVGVIAVSALSKKYFENYFLSLKDKLNKSGKQDDAATQLKSS